MTLVELGLWPTLAFLFWKKKLRKQFPAMGTYLFLRAASMPVLMGLLYGQSQHWLHDYSYRLYFYLYWGSYFAGAIILYFIAVEVFRSAMSPFSGLVRFGTVIFRWAAVASLLIAVSALNFGHLSVLVLQVFAYRLMHAVSILELCLLAFLCLAMNALRLSVRDLSFGIALGFGTQAASDFIVSTLWNVHTTLNDPIQFLSEGVTLLTLAVWVGYSLAPQTVHRPIVVSATSTIYRWNEIASALGHKSPNIAAPAQVNSFFLSDVEKVVEKVLSRNLKETETNS